MLILALLPMFCVCEKPGWLAFRRNDLSAAKPLHDWEKILFGRTHLESNRDIIFAEVA